MGVQVATELRQLREKVAVRHVQRGGHEANIRPAWGPAPRERRQSTRMRVIVEVGRAWASRFIEVQGIDRAMALAAQAFSALIPLLIVVTALVPRDDELDFADGVI